MTEVFDHIVIIQYVMPKALQMHVTEAGARTILLAAAMLPGVGMEKQKLSTCVVTIPTKDHEGHICTIAIVLNPIQIATVISRRMTTEEMGRPIAVLVPSPPPDGAA